MKSQMAACRLAARRMDELFDKYGRETVARRHRADLRRDRARSAATWWRSFPTASTKPRRRSTTTASIKGDAGADPRQGHDQGRRHDHRPVGLLAGAQGRRSIRGTYAGARVAYKALTGPLDPVNEGSFRALRGDHPRRQHHDGALSGADGVVERASCRWWSTPSCRRWRRRCRTACRPAITGLLGGAVVFFGVASEDQAPLRRAEHRRRRLGRTALRGRRVRPPSRSARATCATARSKVDRAQVPGAGARAAHLRMDSARRR